MKTMSTEIKTPVLIYTEATPNPKTLKFVTNRTLFNGTADFTDAAAAEAWSEVAGILIGKDEIEAVHIKNNYITLTKVEDVQWQDIMLSLKEEIKTLIKERDILVKDGYLEMVAEQKANNKLLPDYSEKEAELVKRIEELIDTYVKPAVEMDGGNIEFNKFVDGKVYVLMQGSCSGCPSSTVTLKAGIEGMLKRMIPEVEEVVAEMD